MRRLAVVIVALGLLTLGLAGLSGRDSRDQSLARQQAEVARVRRAGAPKGALPIVTEPRRGQAPGADEAGRVDEVAGRTVAAPEGALLNRVSWAGGQWFALGYNFPWHQYNYDFGNDQHANVHYYASQIGSQLGDLQANGTHVTRWYVFNNATAYPLFDSQGRVSSLPSSFFQNFDDALALASARGIYLIPVLLDTTLTETSGGAPRATIITDPAVRQSYLDNALKPLLQRYATHPNILAWSIVNEPDWSTQGVHQDAQHISIPYATMQDFIRQNAQYIHTYATQQATLDGGGLPWLRSWLGLGLDLYLVHWYPWIEQYWPEASPYTHTAASFGLDKPIVIAEVPTASTSYTLQQSLDAFYTNGFAGALAWCYPNNSDEWCNYAGTKDVLRTWALAHAAVVNIGPAAGGSTTSVATATPAPATSVATATPVPAATPAPLPPSARPTATPIPATSTPLPPATAVPPSPTAVPRTATPPSPTAPPTVVPTAVVPAAAPPTPCSPRPNVGVSATPAGAGR